VSGFHNYVPFHGAKTNAPGRSIAMVSCMAAFFIWLNSLSQVPAAAVSYVLCFILMTIFITAHRAIAACRVFIRLDAYNKGNGEKAHNNPSLVNHNSTSPSVSPRGPTSSSDPVSFLPLPSPKTTNPGICVTMGTMDLSGYVIGQR
jgi:hypothetical protein